MDWYEWLFISCLYKFRGTIAGPRSIIHLLIYVVMILNTADQQYFRGYIYTHSLHSFNDSSHLVHTRKLFSKSKIWQVHILGDKYHKVNILRVYKFKVLVLVICNISFVILAIVFEYLFCGFEALYMSLSSWKWQWSIQNC